MRCSDHGVGLLHDPEELDRVESGSVCFIADSNLSGVCVEKRRSCDISFRWLSICNRLIGCFSSSGIGLFCSGSIVLLTFLLLTLSFGCGGICVFLLLLSLLLRWRLGWLSLSCILLVEELSKEHYNHLFGLRSSVVVLGGLGAFGSLISSSDFLILGDVSSRWLCLQSVSRFVLLNDGFVVLSYGLVGIIIELAEWECLTGSKCGNNVFLGLASLELGTLAVGSLNRWDEVLWLVAKKVNGEEELSLKVVLSLIELWHDESSLSISLV